MKKLITYFAILSILIAGSSSWAATWYVDGWDGDDTVTANNNDEDNPWKTIKRALDHCSTGDTIALKGEFLEAPRDTTYSGSGSWDTSVRAQIFIDKSNVTLTRESGEPYIPVIYGYSPTTNIDYIVRIDNTGNTLDDIEFDAYDSWQSHGDVETHDGIFMTPDADSTVINNCDFENFGREWEGEGSYEFYAIIAGGWPQSSSVNELQYVDITDNDFYDNTFESQGAHELYLNRASNGTFSGNDITNNGAGHPLKLRDGCHDITFNNNTVYGAHLCFLGDYPDSNTTTGEWMDSSYDITVSNNTFTDPNNDIDTDIYRGPVWNPRPLPNRGHFVSEFKDNTLYSFSGDDTHYVHGVTCDNSGIYISVHRASSYRDYIYKFKESGGLIFSICKDQTTYHNYARGDMCMTDDNVIVATIDTTDTVRVFTIDKDEEAGGANATEIYSSSVSTTNITAICKSDGSYFLVATVESGGVKIYKMEDNDNDSLGTLLATMPGTTDSITAMTYYGPSDRLLTATREGAYARIYLGPTDDPDSTTVYSLTNNRHIQAMSLGSGMSTVLTAIKDTSGGTLYLYEGTLTSPITTQRSSQSGINAYSIDGYGSDWYTSLTSSSSVNRKLYWGPSTDPLDQVLFDSQWWHDSEAE